MMSEWEKLGSEGGMWNDVTRNIYKIHMDGCLLPKCNLVRISSPYKGSEDRFPLCLNLINVVDLIK